jgi:hypothetical protein
VNIFTCSAACDVYQELFKGKATCNLHRNTSKNLL